MGPGAPPIRRPSVALIRLQISGVPVMRNRDWNVDGFTAARVGLASFVAQAGVSYRPEYGASPDFPRCLAAQTVHVQANKQNTHDSQTTNQRTPTHLHSVARQRYAKVAPLDFQHSHLHTLRRERSSPESFGRPKTPIFGTKNEKSHSLASRSQAQLSHLDLGEPRNTCSHELLKQLSSRVNTATIPS